MTEPLSLMHPVSYRYTITREAIHYGRDFQDMAKDGVARQIIAMAERYGAVADLAEINWRDLPADDHAYLFEGTWAGNPRIPALLADGPLKGHHVYVHRDRRGVPALRWNSAALFPPNHEPEHAYIREGIEPATGQWHYRHQEKTK